MPVAIENQPGRETKGSTLFSGVLFPLWAILVLALLVPILGRDQGLAGIATLAGTAALIHASMNGVITRGTWWQYALGSLLLAVVGALAEKLRLGYFDVEALFDGFAFVASLGILLWRLARQLAD